MGTCWVELHCGGQGWLDASLISCIVCCISPSGHSAMPSAWTVAYSCHDNVVRTRLSQTARAELIAKSWLPADMPQCTVLRLTSQGFVLVFDQHIVKVGFAIGLACGG